MVQGLTEFLPVSSSGHLVFVPQFFDWRSPRVGFDILVHLATLVAVVGYFLRDIVKIVAIALRAGTAAGRRSSTGGVSFSGW